MHNRGHAAWKGFVFPEEGPLSSEGAHSEVLGPTIKGPFHAAGSIVVHSGPLMGFRGPFSGSRDPLRKPKVLPCCMAPVVQCA